MIGAYDRKLWGCGYIPRALWLKEKRLGLIELYPLCRFHWPIAGACHDFMSDFFHVSIYAIYNSAFGDR